MVCIAVITVLHLQLPSKYAETSLPQMCPHNVANCAGVSRSTIIPSGAQSVEQRFYRTGSCITGPDKRGAHQNVDVVQLGQTFSMTKRYHFSCTYDARRKDPVIHKFLQALLSCIDVRIGIHSSVCFCAQVFAVDIHPGSDFLFCIWPRAY